VSEYVIWRMDACWGKVTDTCLRRSFSDVTSSAASASSVQISLTGVVRGPVGSAWKVDWRRISAAHFSTGSEVTSDCSVSMFGPTCAPPPIWVGNTLVA
jgi:hypothetical protein